MPARNEQTMKLGSNSRLLVAAALLAGTRSSFRLIREAKYFPPVVLWPHCPKTLGPWSGTDIEISQEVRDILGNGEFVQRVYQNSAAAEPTVDLFVAYFPPSGQEIRFITETLFAGCRLVTGRVGQKLHHACRSTTFRR